MIGITIATSKPGCLWPSAHWKPLIDSLCRGGAKSDPCLHYPALSRCLSPLVRETNGRFFPTSESKLARSDDTGVTFLQVIRVKTGADSLAFHPPNMPDTSGWPMFEFPYFGTIGDSKHERQTNENRLALAAREDELIRQPMAEGLWLHFQLSAERRDRDLDNLTDALMPFFNRLFPKLAEVRLSKAAPHIGSSERLWVSTAWAPFRAGELGAA
jgi:hypothetical protein